MKIVCIGDSLTEGLGVDKEKSWPMILGELGKMEVINRGISGDTTTGMVGRFYQDVIGYQPTHFVIMGGCNDLWWDMRINETLANIYSMAKQALHHRITPIIGIPTPIYMEGLDRDIILEPIAGYLVLQNKFSQLVNELKNMAEKNGWHYFDFYSLYMNENKVINQQYFLDTDGLHPNEEGHLDMAKLALGSSIWT
ncbi:lysophospholipase L1-like esterase [Bacillus fengqiuensis]|nr:lysophospholipase L1-like esterase [Bacillus fengqiuensis]